MGKQSFRASQDFKNRIVQLKKEGNTNRDIADYFRGLGYTASTSAIQREASALGLVGRTLERKVTERQRAAYERRKGQMTAKGIALRLINIYGEDELRRMLVAWRSEGLSYQQVAEEISNLGVKTTRKPVERLFSVFEIAIDRDRHGERNSFYGKTHDEGTRKKLSKHASERTGEKNSMYGKKGSLSPRWAGGKSRRAALFYSSLEWSGTRFAVMSRDNFTCQECGRIPTGHGELNVHHIIPLSADWTLRLDRDNLITLCGDCHKKTFGNEIALIPMYQDIVRTARRRAEVSRDDLPQ